MPVAIIFVSPRPGIISREESRRSVAVVHFPQESGARQDVVVRIERVAPEAVASAKRSPGFGHKLHQTHRALGRDGTAIPTTLDAHDRPYPRLRDGEALGRFGNQTGVGIARRPHRDRRCLGVDGDGGHTERRHAGEQKKRAPHPISPDRRASAGGSSSAPRRTCRRPTGRGWRGSAARVRDRR